ncbi:MAG: hypothetical protein ACO3JL_16130 [Myxococcota bacterium]|jgi:hypothetical protein
MSDQYREAIAAATKLISAAILEHEPHLVERARDVDRIVLDIVRQVGLSTTEDVLNTTAQAEAKRVAMSEGLTPQHQRATLFLLSSGPSRSSRRTSGTRRRK